jgi:hypothetical protein
MPQLPAVLIFSLVSAVLLGVIRAVSTAIATQSQRAGQRVHCASVPARVACSLPAGPRGRSAVRVGIGGAAGAGGIAAVDTARDTSRLSGRVAAQASRITP